MVYWIKRFRITIKAKLKNKKFWINKVNINYLKKIIEIILKIKTKKNRFFIKIFFLSENKFNFYN